MFQLLYFLIYKIRTVDGNRGSADAILEKLEQAEVNEFKKCNHNKITQSNLDQIK
jgi:hypothetical protein